MFFVLEYHMFYFLHQFVTYLLSLRGMFFIRKISGSFFMHGAVCNLDSN
jgi:hypothetical protein